MKTPVLILNRHTHGTLHDGDRCLVPLDDIEPHLVTHPWGGVDGVDPKLFPHTTVTQLADDDLVDDVCSWIIERHGVRHIIALHEKTVLTAARLRTRFGLPGLDLETAMLFRDKVRMKETVAAAGIAVPQWFPIDARADLSQSDWSTGRKVIKSRFGVGSEGTHIVGTRAEAETWWDATEPAPGQYEIEEFIAGDMYHCDSVVEHGRVTFAAVSEYISRPGDFGPGRMAGSLHLSAGALTERIKDLNEKVVQALGLRGAVMHLEVFHTADDRLIFLETAARPGGGGIDRYLLHTYGIHIFEAAMRLEVGLPALPTGVSNVDPATWGVVAFYPGGPVGGIADLGRYGIVEHSSSVGDAPPRHCTDYRDTYILAATDREGFLATAGEMRAAYC